VLQTFSLDERVVETIMFLTGGSVFTRFPYSVIYNNKLEINTGLFFIFPNSYVKYTLLLFNVF